MIQIKRLHLLVQCITYRCRGGKSDRADGNLSSVPAKQERERERGEEREGEKKKVSRSVLLFRTCSFFAATRSLSTFLAACCSFLPLPPAHLALHSLRLSLAALSLSKNIFSPSLLHSSPSSSSSSLFFFFFFSLIFSTDFQIPTWLAA